MFNNEKEINTFIINNGIFKNGSNFCIKTGETEYKVMDNITINNEVTNPETRLLEYIKANTYPFIDINITFPHIDVNMFNTYNNRDDEIKDHQVIQQKIKNSPSILKKNFRLIYFETISPSETSHYWIYNTSNKTLSEYDKNLLSTSEKNKKLVFRNKLVFNKIIQDNLKNQYLETYTLEKDKFNKLKINTAV